MADFDGPPSGGPKKPRGLAAGSFIFENSPSRAKGFVRSLQKRILNLRDLPRRGSRVKLLEDTEIPGEIRFIEHQAYLIFYTINKNEIVVLHVAGPGQDWLRLFLK
ncbi:MAG: type II toxin-antitoxin system RelE/ParE family toxin [Deltaproteobacteria bacterium]|nr:type II toxin-antitoxin system RelE/ParE family toxin [Deltaproteobacteria bacterium]